MEVAVTPVTLLQNKLSPCSPACSESRRAIQVNVAMMRAFVRLREALALHKDLAVKLAELERKIEGDDESIRTLFEAIRQLMTPPEKPREEIGFHMKEGVVPYRVKRKSLRPP